jgi:outer membrane protein OmpA-like peptidoglycan-associated protein
MKLLPLTLRVLGPLSACMALQACDPSSNGSVNTGTSSSDVSPSPSTAASSNASKPVALPVPPIAVPANMPALEKIYFDSGKYETPDNTARKLTKILAYAKGHGNSGLVITSFRDSAETAEPVLRLARQRGMAVRSVLISAGITEERIAIIKAQESKVQVGEREANRVEVAVIP